MKIALINIGDELLIGQTVNTNLSWLGMVLYPLGHEIVHVQIVPDEAHAIEKALIRGSDEASVILVTGGLGPTRDDITKEVVCAFFQCGLKRDAESLERIKAFFSKRNLPMLDVNLSQADIPEKARALPNFLGTAPGMRIEEGGKIYFILPGVPYEFKALVKESVLPLLKIENPEEEKVHRTVLTYGLGESFLADKISSWEKAWRAGGGELAYLPGSGLVKLRLSLKGGNRIAEIDKELEALKKLIPDNYFGLAGTWDQLGLERILLTRLEEKGLSLALAESCTGGYISHLVTKVPGASKVLKGSVVVYSNEMKEKLLGVNEETLTKYGAVSEEVVIEMCRGLEKNFGVDCGIAVSGIAGPDGGSPDKPVGTVWIACLFKGRVGAVKHHFSGDRMQVISQAARYGIQGILDLMDGRKF